MSLDKGRIIGPQFMFAVACYIQASSLLTSFLVSVTAQDSWIVIIFGAAVCTPLVWLFRTLMAMFPGKNLLEMLQEVFGVVGGKITGVLYLWFFLTLASLNLMDMGEFVKLTIMDETPNIVLVLVSVIVSAWAIRHGIRVVARYSTLFVFIAFIIIIISVFLVLNQASLRLFLPMLALPPMKYVHGTHIISTIPFGEIVVFLMINPAISLSKKDITKYLFGGFYLGVISVLIVMLRDISVLGNTLPMFTLPSFVTLRLTYLGMAFSRMEILFAVVLIILFFFKTTLLYYVVSVTLAQLLNLKSYRHIILCAGMLIIFYGLTLYPSPVEHAASAREIEPLIWTLFEILLPLLTFTVAKIRRLPKKKVTA